MAEDAEGLEAMEQEFQETMRELGTNRVLGNFQAEYDKLYRALKKSHESEKRLIRKCREINAEITGNAAKVQTALKLSADNTQIKAQVQTEITRAVQLVEASGSKEAATRELIHQFKGEIQELTRRMDQGEGQTQAREHHIQQLLSQKEQLVKERDGLTLNVEALQKMAQAQQDKAVQLEDQKGASEGEIHLIKQRLDEKRQEADREMQRKEKLDAELKGLRGLLEQGHAEHKLKAAKAAQEAEGVKKVEDGTVQCENQEKDLEADYKRLVEEKKLCEHKLDQEMAKNTKLLQDNAERDLLLRAKHEEVQQLQGERDKITKMQEAVKKKIKSVDDERKAAEADRGDLKVELKAAQIEHDKLKKEVDIDRKKIEDLLRERDILNKNVIKADDKTRKQIDLVKRQETQAMNLQKDIVRWKSDAAEFKKRIYELEQQREKYGCELSNANCKYFHALEQLKQKDEKLGEVKKQISDVQAKLDQQRNLYEAVMTDRNLYSKNLIESNEEIAEMRRKFKIMYHQIEQLKEEIKEKDQALIKEHFEHHKVQKANEMTKEQLERAKRRMENLTRIVETQKEEVKKLEQTIQLSEAEKRGQRKELAGVIAERDILGTQLIRRNEELALLFEKIKIQQSTLKKGEIQYNERLSDTGSIKDKIATVKRELRSAQGAVGHIGALRREIHALGRELAMEQAKVTALQDELRNPMNVHRWRKLEGSDPATFEMLEKVKHLQKKLIEKTEEVGERDALIAEKEKLYVQLKGILARQPGPEVAEQLTIYQENLKEKTAQMRQMAADLKQSTQDVADNQEEVQRVRGELAHVKGQYFNQCRQERMVQDEG